MPIPQTRLTWPLFAGAQPLFGQGDFCDRGVPLFSSERLLSTAEPFRIPRPGKFVIRLPRFSSSPGGNPNGPIHFDLFFSDAYLIVGFEIGAADPSTRSLNSGMLVNPPPG